MKLIFPFILLSVLICASCKGLSQPEVEVASEEKLKIGERIQELGKGVSIIFQDSQNNYWFASDGVVKYDGKTLVRFTTKDGLFANSIRGIQEDHLGNMYFDTGKGINKFDGKTIGKLTVVDDSIKARMLKPTDLWFCGEWDLNGVYRCDGEHLYQLKMPKHPMEEEFKRLYPVAPYEIYANYTTYKDNSGSVWFGGAVFGACRFDGSAFTWISEREMTEIEPGPSMGVRSIIQDHAGDFYFGSNVNSKYRMTELDGIATYKKLKGIDTSSEPSAKSACMSIAQDKEGNFWMAHYLHGVWKFDGTSFTHFPVLVNKTEAELFSIYKDRQGDLWLGTHNGGAYRFNGDEFVPFHPVLSEK